MIDISVWLEKFVLTLNKTFADRVWFVGLQGSYGRGEATENSDIDVVVILDELTALDIETYNSMLDTLPHRELICGFIAGKSEILNWEPSDLFQFYYDTKPIMGMLDELKPMLDDAAVYRAIKIGVCNIFHGCVHNMLYEKSSEILKELFKSASFVVQAITYARNGKYISHMNDLLQVIDQSDKVIIETFLRLKNGDLLNFEEASEALFLWAKSVINQ